MQTTSTASPRKNAICNVQNTSLPADMKPDKELKTCTVLVPSHTHSGSLHVMGVAGEHVRVGSNM